MVEPYNYIMIDKVLDEIERLNRLDKSLDTYEKFELLNVVSDELEDALAYKEIGNMILSVFDNEDRYDNDNGEMKVYMMDRIIKKYAEDGLWGKDRWEFG